MKTKKKLLSRAGFTLVELVVTIAVLAILAGVGAAAYGGYITKAQEAKDVAELANVLTAAQGAAASAKDKTTNAPVVANVTGITVTKEGNVTITVDKANVEIETGAGSVFKTLLSQDIKFTSETYSKNGATWTTAGWNPTPTAP